METVICSCLKCKAIIGTYDNLWDKIGKTYYSPISWSPNAEGLGSLVIDGEVKAAAKAGIIENSFLQDLACKSCRQKLGIRVDSAPDSHVLTKDQLILRVGGMSIISRQTGRKASLRIRREFSLGAAQPRLRNSTTNPEPTASPTGRSVEINKPVNPVHPTLLSSRESQVTGLLEFAEWAKETIVNQGRDIGRISGVVTKLEQDMKSLMDLISETRKDLASVPRETPWESMQTTMAFLENEVSTLRTDVDNKPTSANTAQDDNVRLTGEDIDMLTDSITKINQKVLEVDGLKMELQFMKSRLKRYEDLSKASRHSVDFMTETSSPQSLPYQIPYPTPYRSPNMPQQRRAASVSITPHSRLAPSASTPEPESEFLQNSGIARKRKRSDLDPELSAISSGRDFSDPPAPGSRSTATHRPSRLSNVQLIDDVPDPDASSSTVDRSHSLERAGSDTNDDPARTYDSAPEGGHPATTRRRVSSSAQRETTRAPSPDLSMPPPPVPRSRPVPHTPADNISGPAPTTSEPSTDTLTTVMRSGRTLRRAASELPILSAPRNPEGPRLTKKGEPDRRIKRHRHLRAELEMEKGEKEGDASAQELERDTDEADEGEGKGVGEKSRRAESTTKGNREVKIVHGYAPPRRHSNRVLPSIETGSKSRDTKHEVNSSRQFVVVEVEVDARKKAALEARERLVRETLDREL